MKFSKLIAAIVIGLLVIGSVTSCKSHKAHKNKKPIGQKANGKMGGL